MTKHITLSILIFSIFYQLGYSQIPFGASTESAFIEKSVNAIKTKIDMPSGAAIAIVKGDKVIYEGYFGYSNIETNTPVDENTHFYIASTTKAFFSAASLIAEYKGDLKETTALSQLFPGICFGEVNADAITVKHLLTHTSGIDNEAFTWAGSYSGQHDAALRHKLVASVYPDEKAKLGEFKYTNLGYNVMSVWFEEFYRKDWRITLRETVLEPLGMKNTSGFMSDLEKHNWTFAQPYSYKYEDGKKQVYLKKDDNTMYSIGLISTVKDVARFIIAELNEGVIDGHQAIPAEVINKSQVKHIDVDSYFNGYSWGWMHGEFGQEKEIFHTGGFTGASALLSFLPEKDIGIVILQNESGLKANYLSGIIKEMAYSTLLGVEQKAIVTQMESQVEGLMSSLSNAKKNLATELQQRIDTPWNLSHPKEKYIGTYTSELAGEIIVYRNKLNNLEVRWGNIKGKAYAHQKKDNMDINFRPGAFYNVQFQVKREDITGLLINGHEFVKENE